MVEARQWEWLPLEMTEHGIEAFAEKTRLLPRNPGVYVHVEAPTGRVFRIGRTLAGIHQRWTKSDMGHLATFEWAMRLNDRYRPYARKFPQYILFFHRLAGKTTIVWSMSCDGFTVDDIERRLIVAFEPIWEQFSILSGRQGVRQGKPLGQAVSTWEYDFRDSNLPTIDSLQSKMPWPLCQQDR